MGGKPSKIQLRNKTAEEQLAAMEVEFRNEVKAGKFKKMPNKAKFQDMAAEVFFMAKGDLYGLNFSKQPAFGSVPALRAMKTLADKDKNISTFFLEEVDMKSPDACKAAGALLGCESVKAMSTCRNEMGPEGVKAFVEGMAGTKSLRALYMHSTKMGDEGVVALATFLEKHEKALSLNVGANGITDKGGQALLDLLKKNPKVTGLYVGNNDVSAELMGEITQQVKANFAALKDELHKEVADIGEAEKAVGQAIVQAKMEEKAKATEDKEEQDKKDAGGGASTPPADSAMPGTPPADSAMAGTPPAEGAMDATPPADSPIANAAPEPAAPPPVAKFVREEDEEIPIVQSTRFPAGHAETWGRRPNMEDAVLIKGQFAENIDLFGVFDGHGSRGPAVSAAKNIPGLLAPAYAKSKAECFADVFKRAHALINVRYPNVVGCTALVVLIDGNKLISANAGDTRSVLCRGGLPVRLSVDHRPDDPEEEKRVKALGGKITKGRVSGQLAVTRSLGDGSVHPYVTNEPYVNEVELTTDDAFVILACDGCYDTLSDEQVVVIAQCEVDPDVASGRLRDMAFELGSTDNISTCVVQLCDAGWQPQQ